MFSMMRPYAAQKLLEETEGYRDLDDSPEGTEPPRPGRGSGTRGLLPGKLGGGRHPPGGGLRVASAAVCAGFCFLPPFSRSPSIEAFLQ